MGAGIQRHQTVPEPIIRQFFNGGNALNFNVGTHEEAESQPFNTAFEVKWNNFSIDEDRILGRGEFGVVYKGDLTSSKKRSIAVRTVSPVAGPEALSVLLSDIKLQAFIGKHKHVVKFIGACTQFIKEGNVYMLLALCPLGDLQSYLNTNRHFFAHPQNRYNNDNINSFDMRDLYNWSAQIAKGMEYLASKQVIHGDLSARHILLRDKEHAVITDFGLFKHLPKYQTGLLPWRWIAPEALTSLTFSTPTDVWSFGITMWEIFMLGQMPYAEIVCPEVFKQYLADGNRLEQPKLASNAAYQVMSSCWLGDPLERPNFSLLKTVIGHLIIAGVYNQ